MSFITSSLGGSEVVRKVKRKFMSKFLSLLIVILSAMVSVSAQIRPDEKRYVEDKSVSLKMDLPGTEAAKEAFYPHTSYSYSADEFRPGVVQVGPRTTYLKEGLSSEEVVRLLGKPSAISERNERDEVVTIYEFPRSENRVLVAEFVKDALVRSTMESRGQATPADR